jgi:hypothetical protein
VEYVARARPQKADHELQERAFAASGRTDDDEKFVFPNIDIDFLERPDASPVGILVDQRNVIQQQIRFTLRARTLSHGRVVTFELEAARVVPVHGARILSAKNRRAFTEHAIGRGKPTPDDSRRGQPVPPN